MVRKSNISISIVLFLILLNIIGCKKDPEIIFGNDGVDTLYSGSPYQIEIPDLFLQKTTTEPETNIMTEEGVLLGRMLFYDPILSGDSSLSCSSCHKQEYSFTDNISFSVGINGNLSKRNSMHITNALWSEPFFWDGRSITLEEQALEPVTNPDEMNLQWVDAIRKLKNHAEYPELFYKAFGTFDIDSNHVARAIAQFERTLISSNSKWDDFRRSDQDPFEFFTQREFEGYTIFFTETGDCFHCHGQKELLTDNLFHNNGLDDEFTDFGLEKVSGKANDRGKFKTPSLRNIEFTAPYMHDGRFETLEEVVEYYSFGVVPSATIDPLMKKAHRGGIQLSADERESLVAFLKTFSDNSFITDPNHSSPF